MEKSQLDLDEVGPKMPTKEDIILMYLQDPHKVVAFLTAPSLHKEFKSYKVLDALCEIGKPVLVYAYLFNYSGFKNLEQKVIDVLRQNPYWFKMYKHHLVNYQRSWSWSKFYDDVEKL